MRAKCTVVNSVRIYAIVSGLMLLVLGGIIGTLEASASGSFLLTRSMAEARSNHAAVRLPDGKVLVAGGQPQNINCASTASAEIYDPATGTWSPTGAMNRSRYDFTLTLLGNGKVLAVGGAICGGGVNNTAELYDPSTGTWQYTGNMNFHRSSHAAVLLTGGSNAGKVLVIAGENISGFAVNTAELYDPTTGTWASTGSLIGTRSRPQAVVLNDGRVLVAGGQIPNVTGLDTAELYDPNVGTWTPTGAFNFARNGFHRMTVLPKGEVLVTGGSSGQTNDEALADAERYNPATGSWNLIATMSQPRNGHTSTNLSNGQVLVVGGFISNTFLQSAELYDPVTDTWSPVGNLNQARGNHTATVLQNGQVLLAGGGIQYAVVTGGAELYVPSSVTLTALSDSHVWIGLKNSDDQGTRFDILTEVYHNNVLVASGLTRCISGVTRNPSNAKEVVVSFDPFSPVVVDAGDVISLKVWTRIGTNPDDSKCSGHNNAVGLRLYYDAFNRPSRFGAQFSPEPLADLFLHTSDSVDSLIDTAPLGANALFKDSAPVNFSGGNPWKEIGTWSKAIQ